MKNYGLIAALLCLAAPAFALSDKPYLPAESDALLLIPPPPAGTEQLDDDLRQVLQAQAARTPALAKRAVDDKVDLFAFSNVFGPNFTEKTIPNAAAFIRKADKETSAQVNLVKDCWERARPFVASHDVHPIQPMAQDMTTKPDKPEKNTAPHDAGSPCKPVENPAVTYSYPSGNANFGFTTAILLAAMVPEKRGEIFTRGWEFGQNRLIAGVHFPSDIEEGRILATSMVALMMQNPDFKADFAAAKTELRKALGLAQ